MVEGVVMIVAEVRDDVGRNGDKVSGTKAIMALVGVITT